MTIHSGTQKRISLDAYALLKMETSVCKMHMNSAGADSILSGIALLHVVDLRLVSQPLQLYLILVALMAGEAAFQAEEESDETLVNEIGINPRSNPSEGKSSPTRPIYGQSLAPRPLICGSYSYIGPDATGKDYDRLGESVDQKLFFAGEATCRTHPATVHGAYMSGLRAARKFLNPS